MKFTVMLDGKPIMDCEPVTPVPATFEYRADGLTWKFKGANINGCYDLRVDGEIVKPYIDGQTGEIEITNGEIIEFIAVKKELRQ